MLVLRSYTHSGGWDDGGHMAGKRTAQEQRDYMRDYRARKRLEQQTSKGITEGVTGVTSVANVHEACDRRIAELEAEMRRLSGRQVSTPKVDVSTAGPVFTGVEDLENPVLREVAERINAIPRNPDDQMALPGAPKTFQINRPAFLAAKVDDCVSCGHEWHSNEDGGCKAARGKAPQEFWHGKPSGRSDRCGCKAYLNEGEPF